MSLFTYINCQYTHVSKLLIVNNFEQNSVLQYSSVDVNIIPQISFWWKFDKNDRDGNFNVLKNHFSPPPSIWKYVENVEILWLHIISIIYSQTFPTYSGADGTRNALTLAKLLRLGTMHVPCPLCLFVISKAYNSGRLVKNVHKNQLHFKSLKYVASMKVYILLLMFLGHVSWRCAYTVFPLINAPGREIFGKRGV